MNPITFEGLIQILTVVGMIVTLSINIRILSKPSRDRNADIADKRRLYEDGLKSLTATASRLELKLDALDEKIDNESRQLVAVAESTKFAHKRIDEVINGGK